MESMPGLLIRTSNGSACNNPEVSISLRNKRLSLLCLVQRRLVERVLVQRRLERGHLLHAVSQRPRLLQSRLQNSVLGVLHSGRERMSIGWGRNLVEF